MIRAAALALLMLLASVVNAAPACKLSQSTGLTIGADAGKGIAWFAVWCPPAARWMDYTSMWSGVQPSALSVSQLGEIFSALAAKDEARLMALRGKWGNADLAAVEKASKADLLATLPPAPVVVKSNGGTPTRPSYAVIGSTRSTKADAKIRPAVGLRADCAARLIVEGTSAYCAWVGGPTGFVTLVSEVKP